MICISIAQDSRRLALADMVNASRQCDLIELRLDRFAKAPEIAEILQHKPKPVIMSCRRKVDGGQWQGSEEERLALLRMCIASKADYVEIELDVADQIRPFPPAKRVISYTNLEETPENIAEIHAEAQRKNADVIKLVTRADTPEDAWPLVKILGKPSVPTVVVGLGKPGVMLSVLAKKIGAPWTYAALERGMEAYPDQPTVRDLTEVYHYPQIDRGTRLIGVTGFGKREYVTVGAVNAALANMGFTARCLPLGIGDIGIFQRIMDAVHLGGVLVDDAHRITILKIATDLEGSTEEAGFADLLLRKSENRFAYNTICRAMTTALENAVRPASAGDKPLQGRIVMIVGVNPLARSLALALRRAGSVLIIASHERAAANKLAQELECRYVQFEALYSTTHDILLVCDDEKDTPAGKKRGADASSISPGYLKAGMTVLDATADLEKTDLLNAAQARGCKIVTPRQLLIEQLMLQIKLIASKEPPRKVLEETVAALLDDGL
jgi:3-dehydroquinate dehydratase/shikimate dehydrogenase